MKEENKKSMEGPVRCDALVNLVTAPILRQLNLNNAAVMEVLTEVRESLEVIARQIEREIHTAEPEEDIR